MSPRPSRQLRKKEGGKGGAERPRSESKRHSHLPAHAGAVSARGLTDSSSLPAADPGVDQLLAIRSRYCQPAGVPLVCHVLPADPHLCTRLLAALGFYKQAASRSQGLVHPASSLTQTHDAAGRPRQPGHAASSLNIYKNSASRLVDVTPFTPHLQDERRRYPSRPYRTGTRHNESRALGKKRDLR